MRHAIMSILAGQFNEEVIDSQIELLEKELRDDVVLNWFNIFITGISTPSSPLIHIHYPIQQIKILNAFPFDRRASITSRVIL